jgi:succinate dehydrogenase/fumarate reductase flavoprotein subunit
MILSADEVERWTASAELVVVGYGIAGVSGAIEARESGAGVLVLERSSGCTGSTAAASGHFYLGGGTPVQKACGFADDAKAVTDYFNAVTQRPDHAKIEAFALANTELFDWLEARGVPFDRSYYPTKAVIQPGRDCLIWTGNERVYPFRDRAHPAPRGHKVAFEGEEGGGGLALEQLVQHAERIGVEARFDTHVDGLVLAGDRVVGVSARHFGERQFFRAEGGVLLAGGGFGRNGTMMERYLPRFAQVSIVGGQYDDGTAIRLGMEAGGAVENMDGILVTSPIYPPEQLVKGILVNCEGQRFIAEDSYHTRTSLAIIEQPQGIAYLIVDSDIFAYPAWRDHANQQLVDGFDSVAEMASRLGVPQKGLEQTLEEYSNAAAVGTDPAFGKHPDWLKPLNAAPWAVFDYSYGRAIFYGFTLGGLSISKYGEVLRDDKSPIEGLYAAGACASMLAHGADNYASGISLSAGAFFGRQAGRHAASLAKPATSRFPAS